MAFSGKKGDRVRLIFMPPKLDEEVTPGTEGTVLDVTLTPWGQDRRALVRVEWADGRIIPCLCPPDYLEIVPANNS